VSAVTPLPIGTKVAIEGHVGKATWHISNHLSGKAYQGRIVGYDSDGDYVVEAKIKGKVRRQKVKS
jgi:hypothetical protein